MARSTASSRQMAATINLKSRKTTGKGNATAWGKMGVTEKVMQATKTPKASKKKMIRAIGFFAAGRGSGTNTRKSIGSFSHAEQTSMNTKGMKNRAAKGYRFKKKGANKLASVSGGAKGKKK